MNQNKLDELKEHDKTVTPVNEQTITNLARDNKLIAFDGKKLIAYQQLGLTTDLMGGVELNNGMALVTTTIATDIIVRLHAMAVDDAVDPLKQFKKLKSIAAPVTMLMGAKAKLISELAKARGLRDGMKQPVAKKRRKLDTTIPQMGIAKLVEGG